MSGVTISGLPAALTVATNALVPVVAIGTPDVTQRATVAQITAGSLSLAGGTLTGRLTINVGGIEVTNGPILQDDITVTNIYAAPSTFQSYGGWGGNNWGKQVLVTTPMAVSNPAIAVSDLNGTNLWGIANVTGTLHIASMPDYSDSTTGPVDAILATGTTITLKHATTISTGGLVVTAGGATVTAGGATINGTLTAANDLSVSGASTLVGAVTVTAYQVINGTTPGVIFGFEMDAGGVGAQSGTPRSVSLSCPNGAVFGVTIDATSDRRTKCDIEPITAADGEAFVMSARPSTYILNGHKQSGFIAQDMIRAGYSHMVGSHPSPGLPELVEDGLVSKADVLLTFSYNDTIAYLAAALKSALDRIAVLEAKP